MNLLERYVRFIEQSKRVNSGVNRDKHGVEIWNRDGKNVLATVFYESLNRQNRQRDWEYHYYPAGSKFVEDPIANGPFDAAAISVHGGIFGLDQFFYRGANVAELGCGGGQAAIDLAWKFLPRKVKVLAIDHEIGDAVVKPFHLLPNLRFVKMDWNNLDLEDSSLDRIYSRQGVARYGGKRAAEELTRVSKTGALLRGDETRGVIGHRSFSDHLYEMGWDVWKQRGLIVAQKVR